MSRIAKNPIVLPKGVEVKIDGQTVQVKGPKGSLQFVVPMAVAVSHEDLQSDEGAGPAGKVLKFVTRDGSSTANALAGTSRALVNNLVIGVDKGFQKELTLHGVGYRAKMQGSLLNLTLGLSHPVDYKLPEGVSVETPSQTTIVVKGIDKQKVGQVAAEIRAFRPPEPYKGKGIRYSDEQIIRKEAKKK